MASSELFQMSVVTPERAVLETEAKFVAFPAHDGEIGILKGRAPLLCRLGIGVLRVETETDEKVLFIEGGFAQMVDDRLTILTEQAKAPAELDRDEAEGLLTEAQAMGTGDERAFEERQAALERARGQLRLVGR